MNKPEEKDALYDALDQRDAQLADLKQQLASERQKRDEVEDQAEEQRAAKMEWAKSCQKLRGKLDRERAAAAKAVGALKLISTMKYWPARKIAQAAIAFYEQGSK